MENNNNIENKTVPFVTQKTMAAPEVNVPEFSPLMAVKKKLKDGSTKIYYYDQKQYYRDFKDKKTEKSECEICGQIIGYFSKSKHNKTMKHELALLRKKINEQSNKDILI